jgi:hypothetical protein
MKKSNENKAIDAFFVFICCVFGAIFAAMLVAVCCYGV